jgi:lactate permease
MAIIMAHAGMTDALAHGLAEGMGAVFPAVSPWIGALGAFMTGSNTNSNVVFAALQLRTAELLGYTAAVILAAQTAGGAIGSIIAPTKVVVGASTAGMAGREGEVMRKLLLYTGLLVLLISLLAVVGVAVAS